MAVLTMAVPTMAPRSSTAAARRFLFQLEQRWTLLGALLGDRADRIAADQLASFPATLVASVSA